MNPFIVVPTLGNRPSLWPLLRDADMPAIVVWTNPTEDPTTAELQELARLGGTLVIDRGPINIHRWWRKGVDLTSSANGNPVIICNDDVRAAPGELRKLAEHVRDGVKLAYLDRPEHAAVRVTPITGWCFAIDPWHLPIVDGEPDIHDQWPKLRWWYGDHDIELRALTQGSPSGQSLHSRVVAVPGLDIEHLRTDWHYDRPDEVRAAMARDKSIFYARWGWKVGDPK